MNLLYKQASRYSYIPNRRVFVCTILSESQSRHAFLTTTAFQISVIIVIPVVRATKNSGDPYTCGCDGADGKEPTSVDSLAETNVHFQGWDSLEPSLDEHGVQRIAERTFNDTSHLLW